MPLQRRHETVATRGRMDVRRGKGKAMHVADKRMTRRYSTLSHDVRCSSSTIGTGPRLDNGSRHFLVRFVAQIELQFLQPLVQFFVLR